MKILVIFTGGTIGSTECDGWISPDRSADYRLINGFKKRVGDQVDFVTVTPYSMLSENLSARRLNELTDCIADGIEGDCDGIIVAHGTDTLQYSAAAAAFCFGCECKPIMFVSSNFPLESELSNGEINFEAAVRFITSQSGRGVYACYANDDLCKVDIHCAARLLRHPERSDKLFSLGNAPYAVYNNGSVALCDRYAPSATGPACGRVKLSEQARILTVTVSPTEGYGYDLSQYSAIVLLPYHSGTLNTDDERFERFCMNAKSAGIPIFVPDVYNGDAYESMRHLDRLGLTILPELASIPLCVKVWIAVSIGADIKQFVLSPIAQEFNI